MDVINRILNTRKLRLREGKFIVQDATVWGLCGTWRAEENPGCPGAWGWVENQPGLGLLAQVGVGDCV